MMLAHAATFQGMKAVNHMLGIVDEINLDMMPAAIFTKPADDNEETIKKRLVVYHSQTQPLIEWYKQEGVHYHINGLGELDRIFEDICKVIDGI